VAPAVVVKLGAASAVVVAVVAPMALEVEVVILVAVHLHGVMKVLVADLITLVLISLIQQVAVQLVMVL
jgi:hypothetical protein